MLAVIAAVHTPMARSRALAWSANFLTRYHLELEAGNLAYNAVTRRITLTDVRLAAEGHKDRPFLVAKRIEVRLPWSVFRRRFAIDHLVIDQGVVDIYRDKNNVVNLPPSSGGPTPERARRIDIRSLTLNGLDVQYQMLRAFFLPGKVTTEQQAFYVDLLKKVSQTAEYKEYLEKQALKPIFLSGNDMLKFLEEDDKLNASLMHEAGFVAK